jgi:hypothetical protein
MLAIIRSDDVEVFFDNLDDDDPIDSVVHTIILNHANKILRACFTSVEELFDTIGPSMVFKLVIRNDNYECFQWILDELSEEKIFEYVNCNYIGICGAINIAKLIHRYLHFDYDEFLAGALEFGNVESYQWLCDEGLLKCCTNPSLDNVIQSGNIHLIAQCIKNHDIVENKDDIVKYAVAYDKVEVLAHYITYKQILSPNKLEIIAAQHGSIDVLRWLSGEQVKKCKSLPVCKSSYSNNRIMEYLIESENVSAIEWAIDKGYSISYEAIIHAFQQVSSELLRKMLRKYNNNKHLFDRLVDDGKIVFCRWMIDNGYICHKVVNHRILIKLFTCQPEIQRRDMFHKLLLAYCDNPDDHLIILEKLFSIDRWYIGELVNYYNTSHKHIELCFLIKMYYPK